MGEVATTGDGSVPDRGLLEDLIAVPKSGTHAGSRRIGRYPQRIRLLQYVSSLGVSCLCKPL